MGMYAASLYTILCCTLTVSVHGQLGNSLMQQTSFRQIKSIGINKTNRDVFSRWHYGNASPTQYPKTRHSSLADSMHELTVGSSNCGKGNNDRQLLQAGGPAVCQPVAGYTAYAGVDHPGDNIGCSTASVESLAARCNSMPWCASFNTDGCLKYKQNATQISSREGLCFYVKGVSMDCPAVPGFNVQQGRGYNDMTADGDISIGRGCFRNVSITQLAEECQADINCNAFDSWGCLKNYTFLNDNGLGPSYCFYTKEGGGTSGSMPYCLDGWDTTGTAVAQYDNISNQTACQEICDTTPECTYTVFDEANSICYVANVMLIGQQIHTIPNPTRILCTQGQDPCPRIQGFRAYFGQADLNDQQNWWPNTCTPRPANGEMTFENYTQLAANCLATTGCAGFELSGCLATNPAVDLLPGPNCFYERIDFSPSPNCPELPGYTVQVAVDHVGDNLDGSCYRNQTIEQTAQDCDTTPDCTAFNSLGCLIAGDYSLANYNGRGNGFCYYSKISIQNLPVTSRRPEEGFSGSSTSQCEPVAGYTAYARSDHTGDNLPGPNCVKAPVQTLAAECDKLPWCVSFNADGCLKYKETATNVNKTGSCLYTKDVTMACSHVPGFIVQQGRGYNDMTADGDISIGRGCFRNVSIAQLAQECQADLNCNAFDSWGCLKNYTFLNDNGLGPSYCFYTKEDGSTADTTPYCIQGWDAAGTNVANYTNVTDSAACQKYCRQTPSCTYSVLDEPDNICWLRKDLLNGADGTTKKRDNFTFCTKGTPTCPQIPGFRSYFAATDERDTWSSTCGQGGDLYEVAAQCLATPGCAGLDSNGCETIRSLITVRGFPICYWERIYYEPGNCTEVPGYIGLPGFDHYGDDLSASTTCSRNLTALQIAEGCNENSNCTAFNSLGCLKAIANATVNDNTLGESYCFYTKSINGPVEAPAPPQPLPIPTAAQRKSVSVGGFVGIAIGGAVVGLLAVAMIIWLWTCKRKDLADPGSRHVVDDHETIVRAILEVADIPGLARGEAFTRATAYEYTWAEKTGTNNLTPVNSNNEDELAITGTAGLAVQLTKQQFQDEIKLLRDGFVGRGATALVFTGLWPKRFGESAVLAVKVLQDGYTADAYTLNSFTYEATVLASLNPPHPNVIRLYGYCLEPPTVCLILEMLPESLKHRLYPVILSVPQATAEQEDHIVDMATLSLGTTLTSLHDSRNTCTDTETTQPATTAIVSAAPSSKMTMLDVLQITIDIVTGLKYLHDMPLTEDAAMIDTETLLSEVPESSMCPMSHVDRRSNKIVHRDLKPANILLDAAGHAKITDFGLARRQQQDTVQTRNLAAGTLPYMAPELLVVREMQDSRFRATNRVDIYSMAMIMWEMLAGQRPWAHTHEHAIFHAVLSGDRPALPAEQQDDQGHQPVVPLSEMPASLHALPEFNNIIRACWNHREHQRPSAAALYDMLISLRDKYS